MKPEKDSFGLSLDLSWTLLFDGKPWDAALPSSLSDARLEHLWASCQPRTKCRPLAHFLISHLVRGRAGLTREQFLASPSETYIELREELVKVVNAEREARLSKTDARLAERRFLAVLSRVCDLLVEVTPEEPEMASEPDYDAPYRTQYEDDEPSMRIKNLHFTFEKLTKSSNCR